MTDTAHNPHSQHERIDLTTALDTEGNTILMNFLRAHLLHSLTTGQDHHNDDH
ncbi:MULTISPECIES: hypothetical protein [Rhodococcus]|uniref:hypothetical protein n=1 Tax=Rhodococcus TaxID=1827 RepID=UPI0013203D4B|nr:MULTISPECIES: hypothetical protein [Rhodococcus]QHE73059.1 hypothetical protein GFS60_06710 [Rhodococcus sp. WAY2]QTJ71280.1 hypothetical protein HYG77_38190 [Rhodococcus sp. ZPP]